MKKAKRKQKLSPRERHQSKKKMAMPEVKRLVNKYGRSPITACLADIREAEKTMKLITDLRRKARELKRKL